MKRWVPWVTGAVIIGGLIWTFFYLKDVHPLGALGSKLQTDRMAGVGIRFDRAQLVGRSNGKKVWVIEARTIDISKDRRKATFRGLSRGSLLQNDKRIASISADHVVYNMFTQDVASPGPAELKLENGPSLKVRKVFWNARDSKLFCEGGVDAVFGASTMHGERMTADLEKKEITASKVSGTIKVEK